MTEEEYKAFIAIDTKEDDASYLAYRVAINRLTKQESILLMRQWREAH